MAKRNLRNKYQWPIYVGKAIPEGARRGGMTLETYTDTALYRRLNEHARSIDETENLNIEDFKCRYLVVDDVWIPLGESLLIEKFSPVWNSVLDGFGNHDPGSGRYNQERSPWDVVHSGRAWAMRCRDNKRGIAAITDEVTAFIDAH